MTKTNNSHRRQRIFSRSFDSEGRTNDDSRSQSQSPSYDVSEASSTSSSGIIRERRNITNNTVRYVNPQRKFDPHYNPHNPDTYLIYHQPRGGTFDRHPDGDSYSSDDDNDNDNEQHSVANLRSRPGQYIHRTQPQYTYSHVQGRPTSYSRNQQQKQEEAQNHRQHGRGLMSPSRQTNTSRRVNTFFSQQRQPPANSANHDDGGGSGMGMGQYAKDSTTFLVNNQHSVLQQNRPRSSPPPGTSRLSTTESSIDRPFDELSRSAGGLDSLDEFMQQPQDSYTTSSETTGDDPRRRLDNPLSAIEERPSLEEAGSTLAYSYTKSSLPGQANNARPRISLIHSPQSQANSQPPEAFSRQQQADRQLQLQQQLQQQQQAPFTGGTSNTNPFHFTSAARKFVSDEARIQRQSWATNGSSRITQDNQPDTGQRQGVRPSDYNNNTTTKQNPFVITPTNDDHFTTPPSSAKFSPFSSSPSVRRIKRSPSTVTSGEHSGIQSVKISINSTLSAANSNMTPSQLALNEAEKLVKNFNSPRIIKNPLKPNTITKEGAQGVDVTPTTHTSTEQLKSSNSEPSTTEDTNTSTSEEPDLTLHDLCGESASTADIAWRNAIHVLSIQPHLATVLDGVGWTPLHVACLGSTPPPVFMTRSLLYVYREAAQKEDKGGRLPLHLVAASSGDVETMQLLIQEYPQAVYQRDAQGWTPLHLMLKNFAVDVTLDHCQVLLGLDIEQKAKVSTDSKSLLRRRGEHLKLGFQDVNKLLHRPTPITRLAQECIHEDAFQKFPSDVQTALRRLCQWKRRQRRTQKQEQDDEPMEVELELESPFDRETNPAAHFTPTKRQLPLHIIVRRGLSERRNQASFSENDNVGDGDDDREMLSTPMALAPRFLEVVRLFIALYPEGLVTCDIHGYTPLLTALVMNTTQPPQELVELLLGKRTSGYNSLPEWAQDMPLFNFNADRYLNPAMVPNKSNQQLPLHVVAEEMAHNFSILEAVHESYPGGIQVQDARGRTPLHILLRNYQRVPVPPKTLALFLSDKVAQTFDDEGMLPFDLLAENSRRLPRDEPRLGVPGQYSAETLNTFKKFFQGSHLASARPEARRRSEPDAFLWQLRSLPPWLRRQACSAKFIQELIVEELASTSKCALVLLYALFLCILIVAFRIQLQGFMLSPDEAFTPPYVLLALLLSGSGLFLFQAAFWSLCWSMSGFLDLCVLNVWRWVDLAAVLLVASTTLMINHGSFSSEAILISGTVATGTVWFSAIGFLSSWWYGAAFFSAAIQKIACLMLWPAVAATIIIASFAQMFYTLAQLDCVDALGEMGVCTVPESYRLVYYLLMGEPIVDLGSDTQIANSMLVLVALFSACMLLLGLGILSIAFVVGAKWDIDMVVLTSYWEPKLTFVLFNCPPKPSSTRRNVLSNFENAWTIAMNILMAREDLKGSYWYACFTQKPASMKAVYWLVTASFVPLWLLAGLLTFGVLWPPQVRRFLFRPSLGETSNLGKESQAEDYALEVSKMRKELAQIRDMSFERSNDVQREVRDLKDILQLATADY